MHFSSEYCCDDAADSIEGQEDSDSDVRSDSQRVQSEEGRGHVETDGSDYESTPGSSAEAGGASSSQGADPALHEAEAAVATITKDLVAARASEMFVIGASGAQAVRQPLLARAVTKGLVKVAIDVANDLCERDGKALSDSFGNFDRRVCIGWLLADAVGMPLLDRKQAHACGIKAQREGGYIKEAIKVARKQAGNAARAAGTDAPAAQDEAERAVRQDRRHLLLRRRARGRRRLEALVLVQFEGVEVLGEGRVVALRLEAAVALLLERLRPRFDLLQRRALRRRLPFDLLEMGAHAAHSASFKFRPPATGLFAPTTSSPRRRRRPASRTGAAAAGPSRRE